MKKKLIKVLTIILVCISIITTLIVTCYADNQQSQSAGQVTTVSGSVWCSYNIGEEIIDNHKLVVYADNINITPVYITTNYAENTANTQQFADYTSEDYSSSYNATSSATYSWEEWEKQKYVSPFDNKNKNAYVGIYVYSLTTPATLLDYMVNERIRYVIGFEDIITWDEDYINIGDKQSSITTVIKIPKELTLGISIDDIVTSGYLHSEKIGGQEENNIDDWTWKPNIIDHGTEYWITIDNITRPDATDYKALYRNSGHFYISLIPTQGAVVGPNVHSESEIIVLEDMDNIIRKAIEDNVQEAHLIPVADFGSWIANSISGFMNFTIMEGVSIGGIFIMLISFACVMWLLKLFAGG